MLKFSQIVEIIKKEKNIKFDKELGNVLGLSNISQAISRGTIPIEELLRFCEKEGWSLNWLLTGKGNKARSGLSLDEIPRQYCTFVRSLAEIPIDVKREDYISIPLVEGSIAAGEPIISPEMIEGWAVIHVSQVGRRQNLVAIRLDRKDGKSMEPLIRAGSMVAIDRDDREIRQNKVYAVRTEWGATVKHLQREGDIIIMIPRNPDRETYPVQLLDLKALTYDPIIGRVIWNWQTL